MIARLAVILAIGCESDARRAELARVTLLASHIDRLRGADNPDKRPLLDALRRAECVGSDACALKDLCSRAYELYLGAIEGTAALRVESARGGAVAADVAERIRETERDLHRSKELLDECAEEQVRVVRRTML